MNEPELTFALTLEQVDKVLRCGLEQIGLGVLATAIATLGFDNLSVYSLSRADNEAVRFTYTKKSS